MNFKKIGCGCLVVIIVIAVLVFIAIGLIDRDNKTYGINGYWISDSFQTLQFNESSAEVRYAADTISSMRGTFNVLEVSLLTLSTNMGEARISVGYPGGKMYITFLEEGESVEFKGDRQKEGESVNGMFREVDNSDNFFEFDNQNKNFSASINGASFSGAYTERDALIAYCHFTELDIGNVEHSCDQNMAFLIDWINENTFRSVNATWRRN